MPDPLGLAMSRGRAGIRRFECSCKLSGQQQALAGVSGPAGLRPLLSSVCHLPPLDKGHPRVLQGLLPGQEQGLVGGVSDLPGDDRG